jgi:predicted phage terminase large subunit-like protein
LGGKVFGKAFSANSGVCATAATDRGEAAHIPLRMRSASNPGNVGHDWVKRRFVGRAGAPRGDRLFIPARLGDNPHINRDDYVKSLLNLDPVTRARILQGDWEARSRRGVLKREWFEIVDTLPLELSLVRYWDTAYQKKTTSDYTVGVKYGMGRNGLGCILHIARTKGTPHEVETFIANVAAQDSRSLRIILQQEPGSGSPLWIDSMRRGVLLGYSIQSDAVKGTKFERSQPFRAAAEAGIIKLLRGAWNDDFLDECEQFSPDEREYEHDDQIDAACGAFNAITKPQPYEYIALTRGGRHYDLRNDWDDEHNGDKWSSWVGPLRFGKGSW